MAEEEDTGLTFSSLEEELDYWKEKAMEYRDSLAEVRGEYDDFQESSRELEAELEAQLEQAEATTKDLRSRVQHLEEDNESLKTKLELQKNEMYANVTTLEEERAELVALKETLQKYIRQLEQSNDDLERGKRVIMSSLEDFEIKLNQAIERNAMLENELDEKHRMGEMCQRLKDEVRDLHSELSRQNNKHDSGSGSVDPSVDKSQGENVPLHNGGIATATSGEVTAQQLTGPGSGPASLDSSLIKAKPSPQGTPLHTTFTGTQSFTPSTRISALNMVGDLLRKVGALESRLASCRTHTSGGKDQSLRHSRNLSPGAETPRAKRLHQRSHNNMDTQQQQNHNLTKITV